MSQAKIGIIGVGLMGHGIALNIAKSGRSILYLNHVGNQPTADLDALGASSVNTIKQIALECSTIIICVTGTPQVEDVLFGKGDEGLLANLRAGTLVIDCSTAIPSSTQKIAKKIADAGGHLLDAPMTRTPKEAAVGMLNLIVGGDKDIFENALPLLKTYAENINYVGEVGVGHTVKLIHNFVSLGFAGILAEAFATSTKAGIDPSILFNVLEKGGGRSVVLDRFKSFLETNDPDGFVFSISNAAKDTGYYTAMASDLHAADKIGTAVRDVFSQQVEAGAGDKFIPELIPLLKAMGKS